MAAPPDVPCLSEMTGLPNRNVSLISGTRPCNRSAVRTSPYTPQATAAFAIAITCMMVVTIVGNVLVIIAVLTSRSLRGAQNLFLVSLAAADILVATLIIPFSLANELQGYWAFSSLWCEIYLALDVLFCTSSIVHLCAVALDRYLSISRPVSYGAKRTPARIKAAIVVVWLISAVISFPPLLTLDKGGEEVCELNNERWYILYSTIGSFFAPCVIMILVYIRIYQIAKQHTRIPPGQKPGAAGAEPKPPGEGSPRVSRRDAVRNKTTNVDSAPPPGKAPSQDHAPGSRPGTVRQSASSTPQKHAASSGPQNGSETGAGSEALPNNVSSPGSDGDLDLSEEGAVRGETSKSGALVSSQSKGFKGQVVNMACRYKSTMATSSGTKLVPQDAAKVPGTPMSRRKAMANREKRFTFVLAVVMGVFVVCWFPFFLSYALMAVCPESCSIPPPLFKFFFWIGYCNSCLNPVIYTIFNHDFRKAFKRILCRDTKGTFF
ncbi:uncharacterized protein V6R79_010675 [Siganus canaliculatus]